MDDPSTKKAAIPNWQKSYTDSSSITAPDVQPSQDDIPTQTQIQLVEDAKRFLADDSIRNSPRSRKVAFLEKKGLQGDDIQKLLGPEEDPSPTSQNEDLPEIKTIHDSTMMSASKEQPQDISVAPSPPSDQASQTTPARD